MKKKGFTLIELLAVIVILAVLALILTPMIQDLILNARKSAFDRSIDGILSAAEYYQIENPSDETIIFTCNGISCEDSNGHKLIFKGEVPISGTITISETGVVAENLCNQSFCGSGSKDNLIVNIGGAPAPKCDIEVGTTWTFDYLDETNENRYYTFNVPCTGYYKLETWGAQGGDSVYGKVGGKGGYATGEASLTSGSNLYIVVGGAGTTSTTSGVTFYGGYNGGGAANAHGENSLGAGSGGGATHIATSLIDDGQLSKYVDNKNSVLIVAAGGGGGHFTNGMNCGIGGAGGGTKGLSASDVCSDNGVAGRMPNPGTQDAAGCSTNNQQCGGFGLGGSITVDTGSGGGAGWYGGSGATLGAGAGGSSYTGILHNSRKILGVLTMPTYDGTSVMNGNESNGYAKITYISTPTAVSAEDLEPKNDYGTTIFEGTMIDPAEVKYFNVTTGNSCTEEEWQTNLTNSSKTNEYIDSGCMQFYAYMQDSQTYTMILDHMLQAYLKWNSTGSNIGGPTDVLTALQNKTGDWQGTIIPINYTYKYLDESLNEQGYIIPYKDDNYKARLITIDEVSRLVGHNSFIQYTNNTSFYFDGGRGGNWTTAYANQSNPSQYFYLYSYTYNGVASGAIYGPSQNGVEGSWSSDAMASTNNCAWDIRCGGIASCNIGTSHPYSALRPVIQVLKSKFN